MELKQILLVLAALGFVLALVWLFAQAARRLGLGIPAARRGGGARRLAVVEHAPIDAKRRLLLVRRDDTEHLILLGASGELVVEAGIPAAGRPLPETLPDDARANA